METQPSQPLSGLQEPPAGPLATRPEKLLAPDVARPKRMVGRACFWRYTLCKGTSRRTGLKCRHPVVPGREYCKFHGGIRRTIHVPSHPCGQGGNRKRLPVAYSKFLTVPLKEKYEEWLRKPHREQLALFEELAVARAAASEQIAVASAALLPQDGKEASLKTKALALEIIQDAVARVADIAATAAKLEQQKDQVSVGVVGLITTQITLAIREVVGDEQPDLVKRIGKAIEDAVILPADGQVRSVPPIKVYVRDEVDLPKLPKSSEATPRDATEESEEGEGRGAAPAA